MWALHRADTGTFREAILFLIERIRHEGARDVEKIKIQFTLFSAFYSPLISAMSG
jgi:hypothetical protein